MEFYLTFKDPRFQFTVPIGSIQEHDVILLGDGTEVIVTADMEKNGFVIVPVKGVNNARWSVRIFAPALHTRIINFLKTLKSMVWK